jgi:hypothetical protein
MIGPCVIFIINWKKKNANYTDYGWGRTNTPIKNVFYSDSKWYLVKMQEKLLKHDQYRLNKLMHTIAILQA